MRAGAKSDGQRLYRLGEDAFLSGRAFCDAARAYVNFMPDDEPERVEAAYGANYRRLAEIKRRYDPDNLFRMNQNIRPAAR